MIKDWMNAYCNRIPPVTTSALLSNFWIGWFMRFFAPPARPWNASTKSINYKGITHWSLHRHLAWTTCLHWWICTTSPQRDFCQVCFLIKEQCKKNWVFQKIFLSNGSTHHASACGVSQFCFDNFYTVDFHSAVVNSLLAAWPWEGWVKIAQFSL